MKLNNNGWGLKEMIILCCCLFFFFVVAIYFIHVFYSSIDLPVVEGKDNVDILIYEELEDRLEMAAQEYIEENGFGYTMVSAQALINSGYLDKMYDPSSDEPCHGYVNVDQANMTYKGYISCGNYITEGYGD